MAVPLPLFPDRFRTLLELLPFAGLVDTPARFFIGQLAPGMIWGFLVRQLIWTAVLIVWGRRLLAKGLEASSGAGRLEDERCYQAVSSLCEHFFAESTAIPGILFNDVSGEPGNYSY